MNPKKTIIKIFLLYFLFIFKIYNCCDQYNKTNVSQNLGLNNPLKKTISIQDQQIINNLNNNKNNFQSSTNLQNLIQEQKEQIFFNSNNYNRSITPTKQSFGFCSDTNNKPPYFLNKSFISTSYTTNNTNNKYSDLQTTDKKQNFSNIIEQNNNENKILQKLSEIRKENSTLKEKIKSEKEKQESYEENLKHFKLNFCQYCKNFIIQKLEKCESIDNIDKTKIPYFSFYQELSPKGNRLKNFIDRIIEEYYMQQIQNEQNLQKDLNKEINSLDEGFRLTKERANMEITDVFKNESNK
jgi:hypothetical protein